ATFASASRRRRGDHREPPAEDLIFATPEMRWFDRRVSFESPGVLRAVSTSPSSAFEPPPEVASRTRLTIVGESYGSHAQQQGSPARRPATEDRRSPRRGSSRRPDWLDAWTDRDPGVCRDRRCSRVCRVRAEYNTTCALLTMM